MSKNSATASGMRIGVVSDTHGHLHPALKTALAGVNAIIHAGDIGGAELLEKLSNIAPVYAVKGNMDGGKWTTTLPDREVVELEGPAEIRRADGSRIARITANLSSRDLGSVTRDIRAELESMSWPAGYDWRLGGQEEEMATSFSSMRLAFGLAVFMVYLVMASQFESLLHPFVIMFSVPFAIIGVLATMWVFGVTISVVSLIGFILLAGIVVNDAIVLVDYANQLRKQGLPKLEALARAGRVRLRPILMTRLSILEREFGAGQVALRRAPGTDIVKSVNIEAIVRRDAVNGTGCVIFPVSLKRVMLEHTFVPGIEAILL